jgi:hypothetical protein
MAGWFYRQAVTFFLIASLFAFCEDQNRGQPWLYMYWVMLLITLLSVPLSIPACRCAVSIAYVWSGIQKCNPRFFQVVPDWFVTPTAARWHLPSGASTLLHWAVASAPFLEVFIGLALWNARLRRLAIGAAVVVHLVALLFLGPLGRSWNRVVWPWNLTMIALICLLFPLGSSREKQSRASERGKASRTPAAPAPGIGIARALAELSRSKSVLVIVGLYSFLPILSYAGLWDSSFSFCLYSENQASAYIFVSRDFSDRLPPQMRKHVHRLERAYDDRFEGPYLFSFIDWFNEELGVPPILEPRSYRFLFGFLRTFSRDSEDLRMLIAPRVGPVLFYRGESFQTL